MTITKRLTPILIILSTYACLPTFSDVKQSDFLHGWKKVRYALFHQFDNYISVRRPRSLEEFKLVNAVHMGLLVTAQRPQSGAAKSWRIKENSTVFEFEIDTSLKFHNGTLLSCSDAKSSIWDAEKNGLIAKGRSLVQQITCKKNILTLKLKRPHFGFLTELASSVFSIVPEKISDGLVGLGAYKVEATSESSIKLVLNDQEMHPAVFDWSPKRIELKMYKELKKALDDFERKKLDVVDLYRYPNSLQKMGIVSKKYDRIWFAIAGKRFSDSKQLLECISSAVNRKDLAALIPSFLPAYGIYPPGSRGEFYETKNYQGFNCDQLKNRPISGISLTKDRFDVLPLELERQFSAKGLEISFKQVTVNQLHSHFKRRDFDIAIVSIGITSLPRQYLSLLFRPQHLPKPDKTIEKLLKDLAAAQSPGQAWSTIFSISKSNWQNPNIVPLLFQPQAHLIAPCITLQKADTTIFGDLNRIAKIRNCKG